MQGLILTAVFWFCPVSWMWEQVCNRAWPAVADVYSPDLKPMIALTFDDGPNSRYTEMLLDGLLERGVKATFFVIGENVEKNGNKNLIQRMHQEGHLIGNHTFHHTDLSQISAQTAQEELNQTEALVRNITGVSTWIVRPPYGELPAEMPEDHDIYVKWTLDSKDWELKDRDLITQNVVSEIKENDIILMHDCYKTSVESALQIVDIMTERGFEFVTLDRLLTG